MVTYSLRAFADAAANKSTPKLSKRIRIVRFVTQLRGCSKDGCRNRAGRQFRSLAGIRWKRTRKDESLFCSKSAGHSKHAKRTGAGNPEAGQWVLPLFGYGYVPVIFGLLLTIQDVGFARYELFVNSGLALIFLLPVYAIILAKFAINRGNEGRKSVGLYLFQFVSLVPLVLWLLFVFTFGGSPA